MQTQCRIFNTVFNPQNLRLGNKILRQRLKGSALASYYPPRFRVIQEMRRAYPDWEVFDEQEIERVEKLERAKARGKGAPKKRRTKAGMLIMGLRLMDVVLTEWQIRSGLREGNLDNRRLLDENDFSRLSEVNMHCVAFSIQLHWERTIISSSFLHIRTVCPGNVYAIPLYFLPSQSLRPRWLSQCAKNKSTHCGYASCSHSVCCLPSSPPI